MALELTEEERSLVDFVRERFYLAEDTQKKARQKWERLYAKYRSYQDLKSAHAQASPPDRDTILRDAMRPWGAELFVPYSFSVVETVLPRSLSNRPRMLVLPSNQASEDNVENMRNTIDAQQDQIDYELVLQDIAKDGFIYGLGIQKSYWKRVERTQKRIVKNILGRYVVRETVEKTFDDPMAERIDPFDFFWDPYADSIENCEFVIQRSWRSHGYVKARMVSGGWAPLDDETLASLGPSTKWDEVAGMRRKIEGYDKARMPGRGGLHEIWEYHDRGRVVTVLDGQFPVLDKPHPYWHGELPFQIYRPTRVPGAFVGIGEIEPIEDLQAEMNTMRGQRRDNATLKLQQTFAFDENAIDRDALKFGPGLAIPTRGEPRDMLMPINVGDIPFSSYREEEQLKADIERTVGISDTVSGSDAPNQTATGVQLVQAAANVRIQNKTRRLELEIIKQGARQWVKLNQQMITQRREVRVAAGPSDDDPDRRWKWYEIGPEELAGEFVVRVDGGSTAPNNTPQMRQDAQMLATLLGQNPLINQQRLWETILEKFEIKNPESWLAPPPGLAPNVPPQIVEQMMAPDQDVQGSRQNGSTNGASAQTAPV